MSASDIIQPVMVAAVRWRCLAGAGLPISNRMDYVDVAADIYRELRLFPLKGYGETAGLLFEDDGESHGWRQGNALWLHWKAVSDNQRIVLTITTEGRFIPAWQTLNIVLPVGETRELWVNGVCRDSYTLD